MSDQVACSEVRICAKGLQPWGAFAPQSHHTKHNTISSGDLMYSRVSTVNNIALYTGNLLR